MSNCRDLGALAAFWGGGAPRALWRLVGLGIAALMAAGALFTGPAATREPTDIETRRIRILEWLRIDDVGLPNIACTL